MDDFGKKAFVMAIAVVCLTIAIISSFSIGNVINPIKTILKNINNENCFDDFKQKSTIVNADCETTINVERGARGAICETWSLWPTAAAHASSPSSTDTSNGATRSWPSLATST